MQLLACTICQPLSLLPKPGVMLNDLCDLISLASIVNLTPANSARMAISICMSLLNATFAASVFDQSLFVILAILKLFQFSLIVLPSCVPTFCYPLQYIKEWLDRVHRLGFGELLTAALLPYPPDFTKVLILVICILNHLTIFYA